MEEVPEVQMDDVISDQEIEPLQIDGPAGATTMKQRRLLLRSTTMMPGRSVIGSSIVLLVTLFLALLLVLTVRPNSHLNEDPPSTANPVSFDSENDNINNPFNNSGDGGVTDKTNSSAVSSIHNHTDTTNTTNNNTNNTNTNSNNNTLPARQFVSKEDGIMYNIIGEQLYHDKKHFTQGLTYSKSSNILFESNGLYGKSSVCRLNPNTGQTLSCHQIADSNIFAEGLQVYGGGGMINDEKLIQITWKSKEGYIYNATTLERIHTFQFTTTLNQGWGICVDETNNEFIVSDGSNVLHFWDVDTLEEKRRVEIRRQSGDKATQINELEFVNGKVLANIWYEDVLLVIDPISGTCESEYDLSTLWPANQRRNQQADVLNGISISNDDGILYITGKLWNRMYKVKLVGF